MNDAFTKKLSELLGKVDEKVLEMKINQAIEMLRKGNTEELVKRINKMDKNELLDKLNELDDTKLKELNIDKKELRKKVNDADFEKMAQLLGDDNSELVDKIKDMMK